MSASVRLLVIDDEVTLTRALKLNLEDTGRYEVHAINDPNEAVAAALQVRPDVILLDLMMPEMDGGDVSWALQDNADLAGTPIIFVSALIGKSGKGDLQVDGGGKLGLGKPVALAELDAAVSQALRR